MLSRDYLISEREAVRGRGIALHAFISTSEIFKRLSEIDKQFLSDMHKVLLHYFKLLDERIDAAEPLDDNRPTMTRM